MALSKGTTAGNQNFRPKPKKKKPAPPPVKPKSGGLPALQREVQHMGLPAPVRKGVADIQHISAQTRPKPKGPSHENPILHGLKAGANLAIRQTPGVNVIAALNDARNARHHEKNWDMFNLAVQQARAGTISQPAAKAIIRGEAKDAPDPWFIAANAPKEKLGPVGNYLSAAEQKLGRQVLAERYNIHNPTATQILWGALNPKKEPNPITAPFRLAEGLALGAAAQPQGLFEIAKNANHWEGVALDQISKIPGVPVGQHYSSAGTVARETQGIAAGLADPYIHAGRTISNANRDPATFATTFFPLAKSASIGAGAKLQRAGVLPAGERVYHEAAILAKKPGEAATNISGEVTNRPYSPEIVTNAVQQMRDAAAHAYLGRTAEHVKGGTPAQRAVDALGHRVVNRTRDQQVGYVARRDLRTSDNQAAHEMTYRAKESIKVGPQRQADLVYSRGQGVTIQEIIASKDATLAKIDRLVKLKTAAMKKTKNPERAKQLDAEILTLTEQTRPSVLNNHERWLAAAEREAIQGGMNADEFKALNAARTVSTRAEQKLMNQPEPGRVGEVKTTLNSEDAYVARHMNAAQVIAHNPPEHVHHAAAKAVVVADQALTRALRKGNPEEIAAAEQTRLSAVQGFDALRSEAGHDPFYAALADKPRQTSRAVDQLTTSTKEQLPATAAHHRSGHQFLHGQYANDMRVFDSGVVARHEKTAIAKATDDTLHQFGVKLNDDPSSYSLRHNPDWVVFPVKRDTNAGAKGGQIDLEHLAHSLTDGAEKATPDAQGLWPRVNFTESRGGRPGVKPTEQVEVWALPRSAHAALKRELDRYSPMTYRSEKIAPIQRGLMKGTHAWRTGTLYTSLPWLASNVIGNPIQALLTGSHPRDFADAARGFELLGGPEARANALYSEANQNAGQFNQSRTWNGEHQAQHYDRLRAGDTEGSIRTGARGIFAPVIKTKKLKDERGRVTGHHTVEVSPGGPEKLKRTAKFGLETMRETNVAWENFIRATAEITKSREIATNMLRMKGDLTRAQGLAGVVMDKLGILSKAQKTKIHEEMRRYATAADGRAMSAAEAKELGPVLDALAKHVEQTVGDFQKWGRHPTLTLIAPFWRWAAFITKFTLWTLPVHHPYRNLIMQRLGALGQSENDWQAEGPAFFYGSLRLGDSSFFPTGHYWPTASPMQLLHLDPSRANPNSPFGGGGPEGAGKAVLGQLNPFIKLGTELGGAQWGLPRKLYDTQGKQINPLTSPAGILGSIERNIVPNTFKGLYAPYNPAEAVTSWGPFRHDRKLSPTQESNLQDAESVQSSVARMGLYPVQHLDLEKYRKANAKRTVKTLRDAAKKSPKAGTPNGGQQFWWGQP